jgi:GTP-binding protein
MRPPCFIAPPLRRPRRGDRITPMSVDHRIDRGLFVDEVRISVFAGDGGNGCIAFRREKYIPKGGPAGGDGGHGGSVYLQADDSFNTLQHLTGHHHWKAQRGGHGEGKKCHGKNGEDCIVPVPPGTIIIDATRQIVLKDLTDNGDRVCVARGGKGGRGNARFATPTNQSPREAEPGGEGEHRELFLQLKLIADVGLVGKPNAGKSTLISLLSAARPKVAAYPFTTLTPSLGIVEISGYRRFLMADIPGLIEGAHDGAGLGLEFLRHIERTKVILHMLDMCPPAGDPVSDYHGIRGELEAYAPTLAAKPEIIVANKMDLTEADEHLDAFREATGKEVFPISAVVGDGLTPLTERIWTLLQEIQED